MIVRRAASVIVLAAMASLEACSSSDRPTGAGAPIGDAGTPGSPASSGGGTGDAGGDAGIACYDGPLESPLVKVMLVPGSRPDARGGTIVPGVYFLTSKETYTDPDGGASGESGSVIGRHVVIGARSPDSFDYAECEGDADGAIDECDKQTRTFHMNAHTITFTQECPGPIGATHDVEYSVVGNELHLFPSLTQREVHVLQPR